VCVELRGEYVSTHSFNPVACCFLYKAKHLSAPFVYNAVGMVNARKWTSGHDGRFVQGIAFQNNFGSLNQSPRWQICNWEHSWRYGRRGVGTLREVPPCSPSCFQGENWMRRYIYNPSLHSKKNLLLFIIFPWNWRVNLEMQGRFTCTKEPTGLVVIRTL
jgi:hypothetical protein